MIYIHITTRHKFKCTTSYMLIIQLAGQLFYIKMLISYMQLTDVS